MGSRVGSGVLRGLRGWVERASKSLEGVRDHRGKPVCCLSVGVGALPASWFMPTGVSSSGPSTLPALAGALPGHDGAPTGLLLSCPRGSAREPRQGWLGPVGGGRAGARIEWLPFSQRQLPFAKEPVRLVTVAFPRTPGSPILSSRQA